MFGTVLTHKHAQDAASIRTGLAAGLAGISANVTADIQRAAMAIQTAFGAQAAPHSIWP